VFSRQDSNIAPQNIQDASPVWGIKNFSSVRLYLAPQLHRTTVSMTRICAWTGLNSSVQGRHNQTGNEHTATDLSVKSTAVLGRQSRSNEVSSYSLPKTGIFAELAGDFR
jgi:hypothetical protein